jgi:hypothetical protein
MKLLKEIQGALELLIGSDELGNADVLKLNNIIEKLNDHGEIDKELAIKLIASGSKDPDGNYRNFISRLKNALAEAINKCEDDEARTVLKSISIENIRGDSFNPPRLRLRASMPKPPSSTIRKNPNYAPENYVSSKGASDEVMKIFISYASKDDFFAKIFIKLLRELSEDDARFIQWDMSELVLGEDFDKQIKKKLKESNYGIALVSEAFLQSKYIMDIELDHFLKYRKLIPVGLVGNFDELTNVTDHPNSHELFKTQLYTLTDRGRMDFFSECTEDKSRNNFVAGLIERIKQKADHDKKYPASRRENSHNILAFSRKEEYRRAEFVQGRATLANLKDNTERLMQTEASDISSEETTQPESNRIDIQEDLLNWVEKRSEALYAVLGDYGMGKTFNCRIFAETLSEKHKNDPTVPSVVYIDLRDVPTFVEENGKSRQPYVQEIIDEVLRLSKNDTYTSDEIIEQNKAGKLVIIFDGLDEKLVHYSTEMQSRFLAELLNVLELSDVNESRQKVLLSCRSHYFENISQQNSFFTGHSRSGISDRHYRTIDILPLDKDQVRELLDKKLDPQEASRLYEIIESERYLKGIASRPFMLNKLTAILPALLKLKETHHELNARMFYKALVEDTLDRDNEKHTITVRHKKILLTALARELHRRKVQKLDVEELNDWFDAFILEHPKFKMYVTQKEMDILERDLRNSTLLVRFGESDFGFSHSSIYEYFLSEYILYHWGELGADMRFSSLTEQFVLEGIPLLKDKDRAALFESIAQTLEQGEGDLLSLALQIASVSNRPYDKITLRGQDLKGFAFSKLHCHTMLIDKSSLYGVTFRGCHIDRMELSDTNLNDSLFSQTTIPNGSANDCLLENITLHESSIGWLEPKATHLHTVDKGLRRRFEELDTGHRWSVDSVAFSPDGRTVLSGSLDSTLKLWSLEGELLRTFEGHGDRVASVAFSPDGRTLFAGLGNGMLYQYDIEEETPKHVLLSNTQEWCCLNLRDYTASGTPRSWKLAHLYDGEEHFRIDELAGFEMVDYGA